MTIKNDHELKVSLQQLDKFKEAHRATAKLVEEADSKTLIMHAVLEGLREGITMLEDQIAEYRDKKKNDEH